MPSTVADYEFLLWCLFCGGIQVFDETEDAEWLSSMVKRACKHLGLRIWTEARQILRKLAWIPSIHDKAGENLWNLLGKRQLLGTSEISW